VHDPSNPPPFASPLPLILFLAFSGSWVPLPWRPGFLHYYVLSLLGRSLLFFSSLPRLFAFFVEGLFLPSEPLLFFLETPTALFVCLVHFLANLSPFAHHAIFLFALSSGVSVDVCWFLEIFHRSLEFFMWSLFFVCCPFLF